MMTYWMQFEFPSYQRSSAHTNAVLYMYLYCILYVLSAGSCVVNVNTYAALVLRTHEQVDE